MEKDKIKYDNGKLCKRNFKFGDHLVDKSVNILIFGFIGLILYGIWFEMSPIVVKLLISDVVLFFFILFFIRVKYISDISGVFKYFDEYSKVVEPPIEVENPNIEVIEPPIEGVEPPIVGVEPPKDDKKGGNVRRVE